MRGDTNPNHWVQFKNWDPRNPITGAKIGTPDTVTGILPDNIGLRLQSDWEPTLAAYINQGRLGQVNDLLKIAGISINDKRWTGQVWRGTEPLNFDIRILLDAEESAADDVTAPVLKLVSWSSPIRDGSILKSPGPSVAATESSKNDGRVSMRIGRFLYFDSVIIPSLDVNWITAPDNAGQFIAAEVNLSIRTFYTLDGLDILEAFGSGVGEDR